MIGFVSLMIVLLRLGWYVVLLILVVSIVCLGGRVFVVVLMFVVSRCNDVNVVLCSVILVSFLLLFLVYDLCNVGVIVKVVLLIGYNVLLVMSCCNMVRVVGM